MWRLSSASGWQAERLQPATQHVAADKKAGQIWRGGNPGYYALGATLVRADNCVQSQQFTSQSLLVP